MLELILGSPWIGARKERPDYTQKVYRKFFIDKPGHKYSVY